MNLRAVIGRHAALRCGLAAALTVASSVTAVAQSPLALSCTGCHQARVDSAAMPALDNLSPSVIAASLRRARDRPRPGSIMARFAAHMSDAEIAALASELGRHARSSDRAPAR